MIRRLNGKMVVRVAAARLDRFRAVFGLVLLAMILNMWRNSGVALLNTGFHPSTEFQVPAPDAVGGIVLLVVLVVGCLLMVCGVYLRALIPVMLAGFLYVNLLDATGMRSPEKLAVWTLLVLWLGEWGREGTGADSTIQDWPRLILIWHLPIMYFCAGWAKAAYGSWLRDPDVLWAHLQGHHLTWASAWATRLLPQWFWTLCQWTVLLFQLGSPVLFWNAGWRKAAIAAGLTFHAGVGLFFYGFWCFSALMVSYYLLFDEVADAFDGLKRFFRVSSQRSM